MTIGSTMKEYVKSIIPAPEPVKVSTEKEGCDPIKVIQATWNAEQGQEHPDPSVKYDYAYALLQDGVHKNNQSNVSRSVDLFLQLIDEGFETTSCIFHTSVGYCFLGQVGASRQTVERVLRRDPTHVQARELHSVLKNVVSQNGSYGIGIVATLAVCAGIALRHVLKKNKNSTT